MYLLKEKIKNHYELSKKLSNEYSDVYGEIVLYLRTSKLSELDTEDAIGDVLTMMLEGQEREASIEDIFGSDIKNFCDNVISSYGNSSKKSKFIEIIRLSSLLIVVSTFWSYINIEVPNIIKGTQSLLTFNFSLAMLLNIIIMSFSSYLILRFGINGHFEKNPKERKRELWIEYLIFFLIFVSVVASLVIVGFFFKNTILFTTKVYWVIIISAFLLLLYRVIEPKVE